MSLRIPSAFRISVASLGRSGWNVLAVGLALARVDDGQKVSLPYRVRYLFAQGADEDAPDELPGLLLQVPEPAPVLGQLVRLTATVDTGSPPQATDSRTGPPVGTGRLPVASGSARATSSEWRVGLELEALARVRVDERHELGVEQQARVVTAIQSVADDRGTETERVRGMNTELVRATGAREQ